MLTDLNKDQLQLAALMSEISEAGFCAGWMQDLEFRLWAIINGGDNKYGFHILTQNEINQLRSLSDKCGCWIVFDEENDETAVDLKVWGEMYATKRSIN